MCLLCYLQELGIDEFIALKFWSGDLYLDNNKSCFKALEFARKNLVCG